MFGLQVLSVYKAWNFSISLTQWSTKTLTCWLWVAPAESWNNSSSVVHHCLYWFWVVAITLSPHARSSSEAAGSVFKSISNRIMRICLKSHLCYTTVIVVYAPTNPISSTSEANQPLEDFYNELHSVLATIPPTDVIVILRDSTNAHVGTDTTPGIQSLACVVWVKSMRVGNVCWISVSPTNSSVPIPGIDTSLNTSVLGTEMVTASILVTWLTMSWSVPSTAPPVLTRMCTVELTINQTMSSLYPPFVSKSKQNAANIITLLLFRPSV